MKRSLLIAGVVLALILPATASAHDTKWFWSDYSAEGEVFEHYGNVVFADCDGFGKSIAGERRNGRRHRLFRHFTCFLELKKGGTATDELHVVSKHRAKFVELD